MPSTLSRRRLMAAYALLQALLSALAFGMAWWVARLRARRLDMEA